MYEGNRSRARVIKLLGFQLLTIQLRTIIISSMFLQRHVIDRYLIDHNERWRYYPLVGIMIRVDLLHNSITAQPPSNTHINTISARQPSNRQAQFDKKHDKNCNSFDDPIIILCTLNSSISICLLLSAALLLGIWTASGQSQSASKQNCLYTTSNASALLCRQTHQLSHRNPRTIIHSQSFLSLKSSLVRLGISREIYRFINHTRNHWIDYCVNYPPVVVIALSSHWFNLLSLLLLLCCGGSH